MSVLRSFTRGAATGGNLLASKVQSGYDQDLQELDLLRRAPPGKTALAPKV